MGVGQKNENLNSSSVNSVSNRKIKCFFQDTIDEDEEEHKISEHSNIENYNTSNRFSQLTHQSELHGNIMGSEVELNNYLPVSEFPGRGHRANRPRLNTIIYNVKGQDSLIDLRVPDRFKPDEYSQQGRRLGLQSI